MRPPFTLLFSLHLPCAPAVFSDHPFSTPNPCTAPLIFIERRSPKAKRVYNPSEKRSWPQGTVRAGWGNAACVGRMRQHVQESCWHQRENIWKPSTFRSRHVTTRSVCSTLSSPPASSLCHQLLSGCLGFASSLASTPATGNVCYSPKPSYKLAACTVFTPGCSFCMVPSPVSTTFFHNNPLQDKYLLALFSPPAYGARSQPFRNRYLCSEGYFLTAVGLVSRISISRWPVPTSSLVSRHFPPSPHPTSGPCFRYHSNNVLIPGLTWPFGSSVCFWESLALSYT